MHTTLSIMYTATRIPGHPMQMHTTALLLQYLATKYPHAYALNGRKMLLHHVRNLDVQP